MPPGAGGDLQELRDSKEAGDPMEVMMSRDPGRGRNPGIWEKDRGAPDLNLKRVGGDRWWKM